MNLHRTGQRKSAPMLTAMVAWTFLAPSWLTAQNVEQRDAAHTEFVTKYLLALKANRETVFYGECYFKEGGKVSVILPIGKDKALYAEITPEKTVANTAEIRWAEGEWRAEVAQGGIYTIHRANLLIREILGGPFLLLPPDKLDLIQTSQPRNVCKEFE